MNITRLFNTIADLYRKTVSMQNNQYSALHVQSFTGAAPLDGRYYDPDREGGEQYPGWSLQSDDFPCRISSSQPTEAKNGPTEFAEANAVIYVENGFDIQRGDEVRVGTAFYEVLGIRDPSRNHAHREVIARREDRGRN